MTLPVDYANATVSLDTHPDAHNETNAAVNDLVSRVDDLEAAGGATIIAGNGPPDDVTDGVVGDYYLDQTNTILYGPKATPSTPPEESVTVAGPGPTNTLNAEVGVRVQFAVAGQITKIRYTKVAGTPDGVNLHVWNDTGAPALVTHADTQVGGGTFTKTLTTPLAVTAGQIVRVSARMGYHGTIQTVTNSTNCTFLDYRSASGAGNYPTDANSVTGYVVPIFGPVPTPVWPVALYGIPAGGTTGQYLKKTSAVDYAVAWVT